jgi:protein-tyrosine-phosphatase
VTVCDNARDTCPVFPAGTERIHWSFEDPAAVEGTEAKRLEAFRRTRDLIHERVKTFYRDYVAARSRLATLSSASVTKQRVLIVCTGNSARSQIAEGLIRHEAGERFEAFSAGTQPTQVRKEAIQVMRELQIDISAHRSKPLTEFEGQEFDFRDYGL